jgi:predicted AlkP superfamily phosphohydrolase/phosphomutase
VTSQRRLVLIGLDAADRGFIARHAGLMPNVSGLLADGDVGDLAAEALPGAVWPSFCTGSRPPDHGVYHHMQANDETIGRRIRRESARTPRR